MSTGATLEQRVAALESLVASLDSSEALEANYLTVDPQGRTGANFSGQLQAQGVILPASAVTIPSDLPNRVEWTKDGTSGGGLVGFVTATYDDSQSIRSIYVRGKSIAAGDQSQAFLAATDDQNTDNAGITVVQTNRGTTSSVKVFSVGTAARLLLNQAGQSDFLQLLSTQKLQMQLGQTTFTALAGSPNTQFLPFNLGTPWPTNHVAIIAWILGLSVSWSGVYAQASNPNGLNQGQINLVNPTTQNVTVSYLSFGN